MGSAPPPTFPSGDRYEGEFGDDKKEGDGVCINPDGKRMNGLWRENNPAYGAEG